MQIDICEGEKKIFEITFNYFRHFKKMVTYKRLIFKGFPHKDILLLNNIFLQKNIFTIAIFLYTILNQKVHQFYNLNSAAQHTLFVISYLDNHTR